jgi:hypothetical protein
VRLFRPSMVMVARLAASKSHCVGWLLPSPKPAGKIEEEKVFYRQLKYPIPFSWLAPVPG